ncbi:hypothetical protein RRG08_044370 [Elysia crispata]|uniref:Uncharacterized protein n=1 Tax=Elysia crispata TaxID=231223 RepID=A0AAE1A8N8_9GAST|nr:hypothetical protein RRG08_044370 [Elysia crispata]
MLVGIGPGGGVAGGLAVIKTRYKAHIYLCVFTHALDYIILKNRMGLQGGSTHNKLGKFTKTKSQPKPVEFYLL